MRRRSFVALLVVSASLGCGTTPAERSTQPVGSPTPSAVQRPVAWRTAGARVLGVDAARAFSWERQGEHQNVIVATSLATGEELSRRPLHGAPYIGQPRAWWTIGDEFVVHWDGVGRVRESDDAWTADTVTPPFSNSVSAPEDTLLVADRYRVMRLGTDGAQRWSHALPRGAQPPEFHVASTTVGLTFQQYSTTSPTTQLDIPHRVRSLELATGTERWTRDFRENLGAVHVRGDVLIIAQGADLVFLHGPTGEERARHVALGPPNIYPGIVSDEARVVVAVDPFVFAYDLRGAALWRTRVDGLGNGARLALQGDDVFLSTGDGTLVRIALADGRLVWRVGTAIASGWVWPTPSGVLVDSGGARAGVALPLAGVALERACLAGRVDLRGCAAGEVRVTAQGVSTTPSADGAFVLDVESVGFVGVHAHRADVESSEAERPCPASSGVVALDGSGDYALTLDACCDSRRR